jgi:hypothetical protein
VARDRASSRFGYQDFESKGARTPDGRIPERIWSIDHGAVSAIHQGQLSVHEAKERADLSGQDLRAQIYGQGSIPDPLHRSTFNKGGGGSGIERASLNGLDLGARIYGQGWIPDPLCLSTFNRGGGGVWNWRLKAGPPFVKSLIFLHRPPSAMCLPLSAILAHLFPLSLLPPVTSCQVFLPTFFPRLPLPPCHIPLPFCPSHPPSVWSSLLLLHLTSLTHLYPALHATSTCVLSIPHGISHLVSQHHLILLARVSSTSAYWVSL